MERMGRKADVLQGEALKVEMGLAAQFGIQARFHVVFV